MPSHPSDVATRETYRRLVRKEWNLFSQLWDIVDSMPLADAVVVSRYDRLDSDLPKEVETTSDGLITEWEADAYALRSFFADNWKISNESWDGVVGKIRVHWSDNEWHHKPYTEFPANSTLWQHKRSLPKLISCSLLYMRLLATFETLPQCETDGYKCTWEFYLHWPGIDGELRLYDHKGYPKASFVGSQKGSLVALQLIEWLVGENIPHPYDHLLAGTGGV